MPDTHTEQVGLPERLIDDTGREALRTMFAPFSHHVELHVYADKAASHDLELAGRFSEKLAHELAECSDLISAHMHDSSELEPHAPMQLGFPRITVTEAGSSHPLLTMLGAPLGKEGAALVQAVIMAGTGKNDLTDKTRETVRGIRESRSILIFGSASCPYCPGQMTLAASFAQENPEYITACAVAAEQFSELAERYKVGGVPHTVVNKKHFVVGLQPENQFADFVATLKGGSMQVAAEASAAAGGYDPSADAIFGAGGADGAGGTKDAPSPQSGHVAESMNTAFSAPGAAAGSGGAHEESLGVIEKTGDEFHCDLLVLGGGPAGLTAAIYGGRAGLNVTVLDAGILGGQVALTPLVENYPGFSAVTGEALINSMTAQAKRYSHLRANVSVTGLKHENSVFIAETGRGSYTGKALVLATGSTWRKLNVPGEAVFSGKGVHYCASCDGYLYVGKKIAIAGGGNSALTDALHLKNLGADVTIIHRRDAFRAERALVNAVERQGIPVIWDSCITAILGKDSVTALRLKNLKNGEESELPISGVFISVGQDPNSRPARALGAELTENKSIKTDTHMRTSVERLYAAGDVTGGFQQIVTAVAQGAQAAHSAFEDLQKD